MTNVVKISNRFDFVESDLVLDEAIAPSENLMPVNSSVENIFLTGSTGFLGAFLLRDLLLNSTATIYCLVRAKCVDSAMVKIKNNFTKNKIAWDVEYDHRLMIVLGDLTEKSFGISDFLFAHLASEIDVVYHNAAIVNLIYPYDMLRVTNVLGSKDILRFSVTKKLKPIHYISTLYVFSKAEKVRSCIAENDDPDHYLDLHNGYCQTKRISEEIFNIARSRGVPVNIFRIGVVSGDSRNGVCAQNDMFWSIIKICIRMRKFPACNVSVSFSPVDIISDAVVKLSQKYTMGGKNFHLFNPNIFDFSDLQKLLSSCGFDVKIEDQSSWFDSLTKLEDPLASYLSSFIMLNNPSSDSDLAKQLSWIDMPRYFNVDSTMNELSKLGIDFPALSQAKTLLEKYLAFHSISSSLV